MDGFIKKNISIFSNDRLMLRNELIVRYSKKKFFWQLAITIVGLLITLFILLKSKANFYVIIFFALFFILSIYINRRGFFHKSYFLKIDKKGITYNEDIFKWTEIKDVTFFEDKVKEAMDYLKIEFINGNSKEIKINDEIIDSTIDEIAAYVNKFRK